MGMLGEEEMDIAIGQKPAGAVNLPAEWACSSGTALHAAFGGRLQTGTTGPDSR